MYENPSDLSLCVDIYQSIGFVSPQSLKRKAYEDPKGFWPRTFDHRAQSLSARRTCCRRTNIRRRFQYHDLGAQPRPSKLWRFSSLAAKKPVSHTGFSFASLSTLKSKRDRSFPLHPARSRGVLYFIDRCNFSCSFRHVLYAHPLA